MNWLMLLLLAASTSRPVQRAAVTIVDDAERHSILIEVPSQPVTIFSGGKYRWTECIDLGRRYQVVKAWTFIGSDRGNILEADIQLSSERGNYFLQRSDHRESATNYDAWKSEFVSWSGRKVCIQASAHPTTHFPIRVHFQVRLEAIP